MSGGSVKYHISLPYFMESVIRLFLIVAMMAVVLGGCGQSSASPPQAKLAYISLPVANAVSRISLKTGKELTHIIVGSLPHNLVLSKDGTKLFVALVGSQSVAELDAATGKIVRYMLTEPVPRTRFDGSVIQGHIKEHAFNSTTCFDCHNGAQGAATPTVVGSRPFGMYLSNNGKFLYVTNINSGNLSVLDLVSGKLVKLIHLVPDRQAKQPTAVTRLGDSLFVTLLPILPSDSPAVLRRFTLGDFKPVKAADTSLGSEAYFLLPDSHRHTLFVSNFETNTVSDFASDGRLIRRFTVGMGPRGLLSMPDGEHILVANYYDSSVSEIDLIHDRVRTKDLKLSGKSYANPTRIVLDPNGHEAYALSGGTHGYLLALDTSTLTVERAFPIGGLPFDIKLVPFIGINGNKSGTFKGAKQ